MVQVLPKVSSFGESFGAALGGGLGEGAAKGYKLARENEAIKREYGVDLSGITDPQTRAQIMGQELVYGRKQKQAEASGKVNYGQETAKTPIEIGKRERTSEEFVPEKRQNLPEFPVKPGAKKAVATFEEGGPRNFPQPETTGQKRPVLPPEQVRAEGTRIAKESRDAGIPMSDPEGIQYAHAQNQMNREWNQDVESDISQKVAGQEKYGNIAAKTLSNVYPEANDEIKAHFMKKGEDVAQYTISQADFAKEMAVEARKFKNSIANIRSSRPAKTGMELVKGDLLGYNSKWEQDRNDVRLHLKPLLENGFYDTARSELAKLDFGPETVEALITDLGENSKKSIIDMPKMKSEYPGGFKEKYFAGPEHAFEGGELEKTLTPESKAFFEHNLRQVLKTSPSENLVLLRKGYEDKDVDWRSFKDTLNDMIYSGEIKLNDDQFNQLGTLDYPPLGGLDKILFGLKLKTR